MDTNMSEMNISSKTLQDIGDRMKQKTYVLTGAPCSGKTTLLKCLEEKGFAIIPEVARVVIENEQKTGGNKVPWKDFDGFQKEVMRIQMELESKIKSETAFLDRGMADGITYYLLNNTQPPQELVNLARTNQYTKIFFIEQLPIYATDESRKEDKVTADRIQELIKQTYTSLGYRAISVPPLSVPERLKIIEENL
jgi:predicted ATPase